MTHLEVVARPARSLPLGRIGITHSAAWVLAQTGTAPGAVLRRMAACDWGEIDAEEAAANEEVLTCGRGHQLFGEYPVGDGKVSVLTQYPLGEPAEGDYHDTVICGPDGEEHEALTLRTWDERFVPAGPRRVLHSSERSEWYTPATIVEPIRRCLGTIELDPASCEEANAVVGADRYYTEADDGLVLPWEVATVFCNPPYGQGSQGRWLSKAETEHAAGNASEIILLLNAVTAEGWWQAVWRRPVCFLRGRVRFVCAADHILVWLSKDWCKRSRKVPSSGTHSSCLVYLGPDPDRFAAVFASMGRVVLPAALSTAVDN